MLGAVLPDRVVCAAVGQILAEIMDFGDLSDFSVGEPLPLLDLAEEENFSSDSELPHQVLYALAILGEDGAPLRAATAGAMPVAAALCLVSQPGTPHRVRMATALHQPASRPEPHSEFAIPQLNSCCLFFGLPAASGRAQRTGSLTCRLCCR